MLVNSPKHFYGVMAGAHSRHEKEANACVRFLFMFIKPSGPKGRYRPFGPEGLKARPTGFDQVMLLLPRN